MTRCPRLDQSTEKEWQIVREGIKSGSISETWRRHGIAPNLFYRGRDEEEQRARAALGGRSAAAAETEMDHRNRTSSGACHSSRWTIAATTGCLLMCAMNAAAQSPVAAGKAKSLEASLGYSYLSHEDTKFNRTGLNGVAGSLTIGLNSRLAISGDLGYSRAANVLGTGSHSDVLSYLAGPVFYPTTQRHFGTYIHVLLGGARVSGPIPVTGGFIVGSWATGLAGAVGGGIDYRLSDSTALRMGVDYLRTTYYDSSLTIHGQNNIRATVALVYSFGMQSRKRR